jgi:hypothetical protein
VEGNHPHIGYRALAATAIILIRGEKVLLPVLAPRTQSGGSLRVLLVRRPAAAIVGAACAGMSAWATGRLVSR